MNITFPPALQSGQTIGIFSPSSSIVRERFDAGVKILTDYGYKIHIHPQTYNGADSGNQFAGTPQDKVAALMDLWADPSVHIVMASCGGNYAAQMLPLMDWKQIRATPKTLMGFSDTTALLCAMYSQAGISGVFGPTVQTLGRIDTLPQVFDVIVGKRNVSVSLADSSVLQDGVIHAPVFAATFSLLMALAGTPYFPKLDGHILLLEDIGEELSRLDRYLWQLSQVIDISKLAGFVLGRIENISDTGRPFGVSLEESLRTHLKNLKGPLIIDAPIGHGSHLPALPLGRTAQLDTTTSVLIFDEFGVRTAAK